MKISNQGGKRPCNRLASKTTLPEQPVRDRLHDIMSPLNAVSGYVEMLQSSTHDPNANERLDRYSRKIAQGLEQISDQLEELQQFCATSASRDVTGIRRVNREEKRRSRRSMVSGMPF